MTSNTVKGECDIVVRGHNNNVDARVKVLKIQGLTDSSKVSEACSQIKYADVIIDISHEKVDRPFQYIIPGDLSDRVVVGSCVEIPFGRGNTLRKGYVIATGDTSSYPVDKLKSITKVILSDDKVESTRIKLAAWMRERYGSTMIAALKTVLPIRKKVRGIEKKTIVSLTDREEYPELISKYEKRHQEARIRLIKYLMDGNTSVSYDAARDDLGMTDSVIKAMAREKVIEIVSESIYRDPIKGSINDFKPELTIQQKNAAEGILKDFDAKNPGVSLIHGITGSGKTEVYMEIIKGMQERGRQSILLIPEISLTYQNVSRFKARFKNKVCVLHSKLSAGEKYDQWEQARRGDTDIMIGPRSALFAPFNNLGVIIIDEEHESSYKSDKMPKYHAREVAMKLASLYGASLVLGSATPSMESYHAAKEGRINYYRLDKRPGNAVLPTVDVVDMRSELQNGNRSIFSRKLKDYMEKRLSDNQQIMLFLNRRGYLGIITCRSCGFVVKCPHCDVSLTQHRDGSLNCHYCGYSQKMVDKCPECGSGHIYGFKSGTQQVEEQIKKIFPAARVMRLDADTTKKKGSLDDMLSSFGRKEADILLGTQMIVKGHDFPNVSLVGILCADLSMYVPDYRASERTFQLLTQAAGRSGRGDIKGDVIIQTYNPQHHAVRYARNHDYESFYKEEAGYRSLLGYPPSGHILEICVSSGYEEAAEREAARLSELCRKLEHESNVFDSIAIVGPARATLYKLEDKFRMLFYIKSPRLALISAVIKSLEAYISQYGSPDCQIVFDLDPVR